MMRRRRGPGLVRMAATTAVVAGTAGAVRHQAAYAAPASAPAAPEDPTIAQLQKLAALHAQGILSDEEFAAAKAKALGL
jgi:hypothetical protein